MPGELDRRDHVGHAGAAHDHARAPINHSIEDLAPFLVTRLVWKQ
jgi:hypothetical protein